MLRSGCIVILGLSIAPVPLSAAEQSGAESELLQFVKSAHKSSRDLIQTSQCRVKFEITETSGNAPATITQTCQSEHWHSDTAVRVKAAEQDRIVEYVWKDNIEKALITKDAGGKKHVAATRNSFPSRYTHRGDGWVRGLLVVNVPGTGRFVPFEDLLNQASNVVKVEKRLIGASEMVAVRLRFVPASKESVTWEFEIHFDPAVNYLIRKVVRAQPENKFEDIEEVVQFKNCGGGIFFPERIIGRTGTSGAPITMTSASVLSDIRVNQPLPPNIFRLRFPDGIALTDSIRGTSYRVDPDGNPLSTERELGTIPPPAPSRLAGSEGGAETVEEPQPRSRWILPISLSLIAIGIFLAVRRRWSAAPQ